MTNPLAHAACIGEDPEIFFPGEKAPPSHAVDALAICGGCTARQACLDATMRAEKSAAHRYGIFGGTTPQQRNLLAAGTPERILCSRCNTLKPAATYAPGRRVCADCQREQNRQYARAAHNRRKNNRKAA